MLHTSISKPTKLGTMVLGLQWWKYAIFQCKLAPWMQKNDAYTFFTSGELNELTFFCPKTGHFYSHIDQKHSLTSQGRELEKLNTYLHPFCANPMTPCSINARVLYRIQQSKSLNWIFPLSPTYLIFRIFHLLVGYC